MAWARQIAMAHRVMAAVMALIGWPARRQRAQPVLSVGSRALPVVACAVVLAWAIALTVMDQAVSARINP